MVDRREIHPISLKVMRLYKPAWSSTTASPDQCMTPMKAMDSALLLPDSFNKIYTGQLFSSYICLVNTGQHPVANVDVLADLQSPRIKATLTNQRCDVLPCNCQPKQTLQVVVSQEILEPGTHTLRVVVEYDDVTTREKKTFRKFYRFNVDHPFALKTAVRVLPYVRRPVQHNDPLDSSLGTAAAAEHGKVKLAIQQESPKAVSPQQDYQRQQHQNEQQDWYAVEITLTNLTDELVTIESVDLTPVRSSNSSADVSKMEIVERVEPTSEHVGSGIQLGPPRLRPNDEHSAVFLVCPQSEGRPSGIGYGSGGSGDQGVTNQAGDLGMCSLVWCTASGEKGRLSSPPIKRVVVAGMSGGGGGTDRSGGELQLALSLPASQITVGDEFEVKCTISNLGKVEVNARLQVDSKSMAQSGVCVVGAASANLGLIPAETTVVHVIRCVATCTGLHALSGFAVVPVGSSALTTQPRGPRRGALPILVSSSVC